MSCAELLAVDGCRVDVVSEIVELVPGAQYAAITLVDGAVITTMAASHRYPLRINEIQQECWQGPSLQSQPEHYYTVLVDDLRGESRWPDFRRLALARTPIRSILSCEVFTAEGQLGTLNLYADQPKAFDAESIGVAMACVALVVESWPEIQLLPKFRSELTHQLAVAQIEGMLWERDRPGKFGP